MTEKTEVSAEEEFAAEFDKVALAAEQVADKKEPVTAPTKTPDEIEAERVSAEATAKATTEAKAREEANRGKTPEEIEAERVAAETATKEAAEAKVRDEAAAKVRADSEAKAQADAQAKTESDAKVKAEADAKARADSVAPYEPSEDEKKALAQFEKDFPTEYAAMQARLKAADKATNAKVQAAIEGVMKVYGPRLAAVENVAGATAQDQHFAELRRQHVDYDAVIAKIPAWIKSLPEYAQAGAQAVYDGGTTGAVAALVSDFKKATGVVAQGGDNGAAEKARLEAEAKAAAKAKAAADAAALIPVGSRRTNVGPKGKADPNDFDGAFDEVAATYEKK